MKNVFFATSMFGLLAGFSAQASVALVPGVAPVALPGTTAAAEGDLPGTVLEDVVTPFSIPLASGALLFAGNLQSRVVRSTSSQLLHFYWRVRDTQPGLNGIVKTMWVQPFGTAVTPRLMADWRVDGLGMVPVAFALRGGGPGTFVRFDFPGAANPLVGGRDSRFFFLKTMSKNYALTGTAVIRLTTGENAFVKTFAPIP